MDTWRETGIRSPKNNLAKNFSKRKSRTGVEVVEQSQACGQRQSKLEKMHCSRVCDQAQIE